MATLLQDKRTIHSKTNLFFPQGTIILGYKSQISQNRQSVQSVKVSFQYNWQGSGDSSLRYKPQPGCDDNLDGHNIT